jgi:hypothetical protein
MSVAPPPPTVIYAQPPPAQSIHYAQSIRSVSPSHRSAHHGHELREEKIEESAHISGPFTVLVPEREREHRIIQARESDDIRSVKEFRESRDVEERQITRVERDVRSERDIKDEIRALEAERRMLRYEREGDYEFIERREPKREVVRIEKDRKGRLALVRSAH